MGTTIKMNLSQSSIKQAMKELQEYKKRMLKNCEVFVKRLAEMGISVAEQNVSDDYRPYILFGVDVEGDNNDVRAIMYATNTGLIRSEWRTNNTAGGVAEADVSPILMAEFGAGLMADEANPNAKKFGMGTGTFPGQTHAENPEGWWYMDLDYEWHHSYGVMPTMPMAHAAEEMIDNIGRVAREVFRT